jgi:phosphate:Na+ symporter
MFEVKILLSVLIGLVIFLFGIENFSSEIQRAAGEKFKKFLRKATDNKYKATLFGAITTAILNSSTATTLIAVGLINAGLISFAQSIGIIFGANIGSTITAQLVALKLTAFAPYLMILGFFMNFIKKTKFIGKSFFFFGMVFFGLTLISNSVAPLANNPEIIKYFLLLSSIPLAVFVGFIFTTILNSSALTMGLVIVLASSGLISLSQGIPLLLGANLGTTVTTLIAATKMNLYAKRAAVSHLLFNVIGVILMLPLIGIYTDFISKLGGSVEQQIANAHTIFNILAALIFLAFIVPFRRIVETLVRGREEEILLKTKYLEEKLPEDNKQAFELIEKEIKYSLEICLMMFSMTLKLMKPVKETEFNKLKKLGVLTNIISKSISDALFYLSQRRLNEDEAKKVLLLVRLSNSLEQIADLAEELGEISETIRYKGSEPIFEGSTRELDRIHSKLLEALKLFYKNFPEGSSKIILKTISPKSMDHLIDESYKSHIKILKKESYSSGSLFVETLSIIENSVYKLRELLSLSDKYKNLRDQETKHLNKE